MRGDPVEEPAVVAAHEAAPAESLQTFLQGPQGVHVEVVGRLVEQDHVCPLLEHASEVDPVSLAPGQVLDLLLLIGAPEIKSSDIPSGIDLGFPKRHSVLAVRDHFPDCLVPVQRAVLVHVPELHRSPHLDGPRIRLDLTHDHSQKGRLPRAVWPDDADDSTPGQAERHLLEEHVVPVGFCEVIGL